MGFLKVSHRGGNSGAEVRGGSKDGKDGAAWVRGWGAGFCLSPPPPQEGGLRELALGGGEGIQEGQEGSLHLGCRLSFSR